MYDNYAAILNGKHTYRYYGLYVTNNNPIQPPTIRTTYLPIPGRAGDVDLTEALTGYTVYGNRQIILNLAGKKPSSSWPVFMRDILNDLHGKKVQVIFDDEPEWFFEGRARVESDYEKGNDIARFTLTINADPYRQSILSSTDPWKWGPFSLVDGVIRSYSKLDVKGISTYRVVGSEKPTIPIITASTDMLVEFQGKEYQLRAGENKVYDIILMNKEYDFIFKGSGTVSIEYRAGRL